MMKKLVKIIGGIFAGALAVVLMATLVLSACGCTARQARPVSAASVVAKATSVQQGTIKTDSVKTDVISLWVTDADRKLVLTESFEEPTMVIRGECPKSRVFLADGSGKKLQAKECLIWLTDAGIYYSGIRDYSWIVTYVTGSITEWHVTAAVKKLRDGLRRDYDNEAYTQ